MSPTSYDALLLRNITQRIEDQAAFELWVWSDPQKMDGLFGIMRVEFVNTLNAFTTDANLKSTARMRFSDDIDFSNFYGTPGL